MLLLQTVCVQTCLVGQTPAQPRGHKYETAPSGHTITMHKHIPTVGPFLPFSLPPPPVISTGPEKAVPDL